VTQLERDAASGTAIQEVAFWLNLQRALEELKAQRDAHKVGQETCTLAVAQY
jgi:dynein heavy chain 1